MASQDAIPQSILYLSPEQQALLFAALNANNANNAINADSSINPALSMSHELPETSPVRKFSRGEFQEATNFGPEGGFAQDSGYDYSFQSADDSHLVESPDETSLSRERSHDIEKRGFPDEEIEDEVNAKRRESGQTKVPKKPGRKPLTTEPTSKRKAQNRAAQRAFRERKETHLQDLENKISELEQTSKTTETENQQLRSQVEKMTVELEQYKKRLSSLPTQRPSLSNSKQHFFGSSIVNNLEEVNFSFDLPQFGASAAQITKAISTSEPSSAVQTPMLVHSPSQFGGSVVSQSAHSTSLHRSSSADTQAQENLAQFSSIFSPPLTSNNVASVSKASTDSSHSSAPTLNSSPSDSASSHKGPTSSCGTSPEPPSQSPAAFRPSETMATIGEEQPLSLTSNNLDLGHFANLSPGDFDLLSGHDSFEFNPDVFTNYRDTQDTFGSNAFDDTYFGDADFATPFNVAPDPIAPKTHDLAAEIDAVQDEDAKKTVGGGMLTCNKVWEKLQACPKVQNGDFDLDGLCNDLQKKATCGGINGPVVKTEAFDAVVQKWLKKDEEQKMQPSTGIWF